MQYVFVSLILIVAAGLARSWWLARNDRDPITSVDSFNRALTAMQPVGAPAAPGSGRDGSDERTDA